jgi:hypothetical protein
MSLKDLNGTAIVSFVIFFRLEKGRREEVQSQLYVALDQDYITRVDFESVYSKAKESGRVIAGLGNYLKQSNYQGLKFRR